MSENRDMVLEALLKAGRKHAPDIPEDLLIKVYEIQIKCQYEKDRQIPLNEMAHVVEAYINSCQDYEEDQ